MKYAILSSTSMVEGDAVPSQEIKFQVKPILCRAISPFLDQGITALIATGEYHSKSEALAKLAEESAQIRLAQSPELREMVSLMERTRR